MPNDLHDPLGLDSPAARASASAEIAWGPIALGGLGLLALGLVAFSIVTDNGMGGRPYAEASIDRHRVEVAPVLPPPPPAPPVTAAAIEGAPDLPTRYIPPAGEAAAPPKPQRSAAAGPLILHVPRETSVVPRETAAPAVQLAPAPDPRLVEKGAHGLLPRIGPDGARPSDVYARPLPATALRATQPRIALIVGGMGLNVVATRQAIEALPDEVTLAFAPYGSELAGQVSTARARGHEVMLQLPMEPHDASDLPGPRTLMSGAEAAANLDHLHWFLSRMSGYVGVINFLGGKFTAREADLTPVLREIGTRGLVYLDDGTSAQSVAIQRAQTAGVVAAKADVILDAAASAEAVDAALVRLEALARTRGFAIGFAQGLPFAIEPISRFARALDKRGITLVPFSALATRQVTTSAAAPPPP